MASMKRVELKSGRIVYRIVICMGYDNQGNKMVRNLTYSVNQSATPKQQEKEANKYAMDMEDKIKYGYEVDAAKVSFEDFTNMWLESIKESIDYGTYIGYERLLKNNIVPYFKGYKINHIKTPIIEAFYKTLINDYAIGTINLFANVLSSIFNTAMRWSMIEHNPCREARKPKKKQEDTLKYFTPKQSLMFLESLNLAYDVSYKANSRIDDTGKSYLVNDYTTMLTVPLRYKVFFSLSLLCGFRKGEIVALTWNDINFEKREISISKSVGLTENGYECKQPKTLNSIRTVPFPDKILHLLKEYKKETTLYNLRRGSLHECDKFLFKQDNGKHMSKDTAYLYFKAHINRYNKWIRANPEKAKINEFEELPMISLHGLRHSCATLLNYLDMNIIDISKILGHSNCTTTMNIYAHSFEEQKRVASNKLNDFLSGSK